MFEEREISIKNMVISALLKWRMIIVVAILLAVAVPLAKYGLDRRKSAQEAERVIMAEDIYDANVGALADLYEQYNALNEQLNQYSNAGLNPTEVKYAYIQYYIEPKEMASGTDASDALLLKMAEKMNANSDDTATLYQYYLQSDEFVRPLMETVGITQEAMFRQFFQVSGLGHNLRIKMPYTDEVDVDLMISTAENLIDGKIKEFQIAEEHELKLISTGRNVEKNSVLTADQYTITSERYSINRWISSIQAEMTTDQISYAQKIADGTIKEGDDMPVSVLSSGEEEEVTIQIKFVIIGAFLGFFLMFAWYAAKYAMSGKLASVEEISGMAKVRVFETLELPRKKKVLHGLDDKLIYLLHNNKRKLNEDQQIAAIVSAISLYAEQNEIKTVCLTSTRYGKLNEDVMTKIVDALAKEHLEVKLVDDVAYDKDALRACVAADGVVLVEQVGRSVLSEIEKLLKSANEYKINVIGSVILE